MTATAADSGAGGPWKVERFSGSAADFHAREVDGSEPVSRTVWWFEVTEPTVVLGSTQAESVVDVRATDRHGVAVARRRSGGGAVWLAPGEVTWVDVVLPAGDPLWDDDVSRAGEWLGRAWVRALGSLGIGGLRVHRGPLVSTPWSSLVCFAGVGPGEVLVADGAKLVGISQRRTRGWARFQCAVLHRWDPGPLLDTLTLDPGRRLVAASELASVARGLNLASPTDLSGESVVTALVANLP